MNAQFDPNYTGPVDPREPYEDAFSAIRHLHKAVHVTPRSILRKKLHAVFVQAHGQATCLHK